MGDSCWGGHFREKKPKTYAFGLLTLALTSPHPNNECVEDKSSAWNEAALCLSHFCSLVKGSSAKIKKKKKSNSSSFWMLSLYWRSSLTTPRATSQQPLHYVPMVTIQNVSECVWERSSCLFMCVCYSCVAYFYIMNQLSRLWRDLIWIIADGGGEKKILHTGMVLLSINTWYFPWRRCSTGCLRRGCIIGSPTDIICLPICTLPAQTSFRNSVSECGWSPQRASVVEIVTQLPLLANIGPCFFFFRNPPKRETRCISEVKSLPLSLINDYLRLITDWCMTTLVNCSYSPPLYE